MTTDNDSYFDIRIVEAPDSADKESASRAQQEDTRAEQGEAHSGRPNTEKEIRKVVKLAWTTDPDFRALPDRQAQSAEVRARLLGEDARDAHDTVGYSTNTIKRIIGQVVKRLGKAE